MESAKKTLTGQATDEQIAKWKKQYVDIYAIITDGKIAYIRKPRRAELSLSMTYFQTDPLRSTEMILQNCWLGGCTEIKDDDRLFLGVNQQIQSIIEAAEVEVKKL